MFFRYLLLLILLTFTLPTQAARYALLIGNQDYKTQPLDNPENDARDMAEALKALDFTVTLLLNANKRSIVKTVRQFANNLSNGDIALFYFSGHGVQVRRVNYLVPLESKIYTDVDAEYEFYDAQRALAEMKRTNSRGVNIMILDACRDNPFKSLSKSFGRGLAKMDAPVGSLIAYATAPNTVAWGDDKERNSIYTKHLLDALKNKAHLSILDLLTDVAGAVSRETQGEQSPWKHDSLTRRFCLSECGVDKKMNALERQIAALKQQVAENQRNADLQVQVDALERQVRQPSSEPQYRPGQEFQHRLKDGGLGPKMVVIPKGSFRMGDIQGGGNKYEKPVHRVTIDYEFAMSKYEVTFDEYDKFCEAAGCEKPDDRGWGRGSRPVINVSWHDAKAYAQWLTEQTGYNYRLPSEAEWEYVARAGTETKYWWGNEGSHEYMNFKGQSSKDQWKYTAPVGSFPSSPFGLHDMNGNVWEWNEDSWHDNYNDAPTDGNAWKKSNENQGSLRGGSWYDTAKVCRSVFRLRRYLYEKFNNVGFRLAVSLP